MVAWRWDDEPFSARDEDRDFDGTAFYEMWRGPSADAAARLILLHAIDEVIALLPSEGEPQVVFDSTQAGLPTTATPFPGRQASSPSAPPAPEGLSAGSSPAQGHDDFLDAA